MTLFWVRNVNLQRTPSITIWTRRNDFSRNHGGHCPGTKEKKNDNAEEGKNHETEQNIHFSICYISYQAVDLKSSIWCVVWTPSSSWKPVQFSKFSVQLRIILPHHRRGEELREEKEMRQEETSLPLNLNWHQLSVQWSELSCECERSEEVKCMVPNRRLRIEMRMYGEDTQGMLQ